MSAPIVVVDDLRFFPDIDAQYLRTLDEAFDWFERDWDLKPVELWLDHDLGGNDTIRPFVRTLEQYAYDGYIGARQITVRIITDNPVGRKYIEHALERYYEIRPARRDLRWQVEGVAW